MSAVTPEYVVDAFRRTGLRPRRGVLVVQVGTACLTEVIRADQPARAAGLEGPYWWGLIVGWDGTDPDRLGLPLTPAARALLLRGCDDGQAAARAVFGDAAGHPRPVHDPG